MQDGLVLGLDQRNLNRGFNIRYYFGGEYTGYAYLLMRRDKLIEWESFYPRNEYKGEEKDGFGSLCHCATMRMLDLYLADDWRIGHMMQPFDIEYPRYAQLYSMGIDPRSTMKVRRYREIGEEYAKGKYFYFDQVNVDYGEKGEMLFRFPSPLNILNCPHCLESGVNCPLLHATKEAELIGLLDQRAPKRMRSNRKIFLNRPRDRHILQLGSDGMINARCVTYRGDREILNGMFPIIDEP